MAQLSKEPKSGLVLLLIGLALIVMVNVHDLVAHLAGVDYRLQMMGFDPQLALVEVAVPVVQILGSLLFFLGILFLFIQVHVFRYGCFIIQYVAVSRSFDFFFINLLRPTANFYCRKRKDHMITSNWKSMA